MIALKQAFQEKKRKFFRISIKSSSINYAHFIKMLDWKNLQKDQSHIFNASFGQKSDT